MIDHFGVSLSAGLIFFATAILIAVIKQLWPRLSEMPKPESFWWMIGVFFHWWATLNNNILIIYNEYHWINLADYHLVSNFGKSLAVLGGIFYLRALTLSGKRTVWPWAIAMSILVMFVIFFVLRKS